MKYSIEGIENSRIIKSTQIINKKDSNKAIIVNYLDGTQDVFELNEENLEKIEEIAEDQGKKFISGKGKVIKKFKIASTIYLGLFGINLVLFFGRMIAMGFTMHSIITGLASVLLAVATGISTINIKNKEKYIKKYQLYFDQIKDKINDYQEILEKEKQLTNQKSNNQLKLDSVLDLDSVSLKQVERINEKVDRYYKVDKQKVKKLENPSLH